MPAAIHGSTRLAARTIQSQEQHVAISGREAAAAIRIFTRQLDADANDTLRQQLERPVGDLFAAVGIDTDQELLRVISRWVSHGTSPRSLASGTSRLLKEPRFLQLRDEQRARLSAALGEQNGSDSQIAQLLSIRQRRRNVHSQVRSVLRALDADWLSRHMDEFSPEFDPSSVLAQAHSLNTASLSRHEEFFDWAMRLADFYSGIISNGRPSSDSRRALSVTSSTARTYRSSWLQFWKELRIGSLLEQLSESGSLDVSSPRLFSSHDASFDSEVRLHVTASEAAEDIGAWNSPYASVPSSPRGFFQSSQAALERIPERFERVGGSLQDTGEDDQRPAVAATLTPQSEPAREFSTQWASLKRAEYEFAEWAHLAERLAGQGMLWELRLTVDLDGRPFIVKLADVPLADAVREAARTFSTVL